MKKIIFYAVVRSWGGAGYKIIAATTEKGRQVYGRELGDEASTHVAVRDVLARLPDRQSADRFLMQAEKIKAKHRTPIKEARQALARAELAERAELELLVSAHQ